jgi:adenine-specific DNA-methyltransferase
LKSLFGEQPFDFSKSTALVRDSILASGGRIEDSIILDYFAGSGTTGHAVINLNREDGGRRKFILVEMAAYFDTVLLPRLKKVTFSPEWKDGKPKRVATAEEAERGPRIIKVIRLESYEDALNNLLPSEESSGQVALQFEDYLLKYMLQWETRKSETLLNVEKISKPFDYCLHIYRDGETRVQKVDLPETFNYLIGLDVAKRQLLDDNGRYYLVYRGVTRDGKSTVVIWRETAGWTEEDYKSDRDFVAKHKFTEGADVIYVNGDSLIPGAQALEGVFKAKMFAGVEG